jgi:hypothetical protein
MHGLPLYFAGEFSPAIAQRQAGALWFLYPVKQYGPAGFLDGGRELPWYLVQVAVSSRDFIDVRVLPFWLIVVSSINLAALMLCPDLLPIRLLWLGLAAGSIPMVTSFLGAGGFSVSASLFLVCACESALVWLFISRKTQHSS